MMAMLLNNPLVVGLLLLALAIGVVIGLALVAGVYIYSSKQGQPKPQRPIKPRRMVSPKRYRKDSEQRAALQAALMVASGTIQTPTRR